MELSNAAYICEALPDMIAIDVMRTLPLCSIDRQIHWIHSQQVWLSGNNQITPIFMKALSDLIVSDATLSGCEWMWVNENNISFSVFYLDWALYQYCITIRDACLHYTRTTRNFNNTIEILQYINACTIPKIAGTSTMLLELWTRWMLTQHEKQQELEHHHWKKKGLLTSIPTTCIEKNAKW